MLKAIRFPSGDQSVGAWLSRDVLRSSSVPAAAKSRSTRFQWPPRLEVNTIRLPSGDQVGLTFIDPADESRVATPRESSITQTPIIPVAGS